MGTQPGASAIAAVSRVDAARSTDTVIAQTFGKVIRPREGRRSASRLYSGALLTLGAAAIHLAVAPGHFNEYVPYGLFFISLGIIQVALAIAIVVAPRRRLFIAAAAGTSAVIGLWLMSRTVGVPIAPAPWHPEPVGSLDLIATFMEATSILLFLLLIRSPRRPKVRGRVRVGLATMPAALLAIFATWLGAGSALNPMPVAFSAAPAVPGQAATSVAGLVAAPGNEPIKSFTLTAGVTTIGGRQAWTYNGTVPGPEIRVTQGDRVRVTLVNHLPDATSIHWHGIDVPNAMDGVAGITQNAVPPGGTYLYEFVANDVGTYWYHSHEDASNQIPRGLFGAIVVEPKSPPTANVRDYTLLLHTQPGGSAIQANGSMNLHLDARPGESVRLRIINAVVPGTDGAPLYPALVGAPYVVEALDGHDINGPQELGPERIPLGMGQRADLVFTMPGSGAVRLVGLKAASLLPWIHPATASVAIGDGAVPSINLSSVPKFDLTHYGVPALDPVADASKYDVTRVINLDFGLKFHNGGLDFSNTFDDMPSPFEPPLRVREGQLALLHLVNNSPHYHPVHIHGHIFSIVAKNGHRLTGSPIHVDAVLVSPHETWDVAFRADNPGIWMLHCHALGHAVSGMSMTINYEGVYSPYTMGSRSGNVPE